MQSAAGLACAVCALLAAFHRGGALPLATHTFHSGRPPTFRTLPVLPIACACGRLV